jgi:type IV secretory pathway VirB10-like protein
MTEHSTVEIQSDSGEKAQWGVNLFFFKDGGKLTVRKKSALIVGIMIIAVVSVLQSFDPTTNVVPVGESSISTPAGLSTQKSFDLAEAPKETGLTSKKAGGKITKYAGPQLLSRPRDLKLIPPGSMMRAVLLSGASNGLVRAEVKEALTVDGTTFIEEGSTLLGNGGSTEERLFVAFSQVIFKDGTFGQIQAQACDKSDQIVGLKGSKVGTKALNIAGSIGLGFVGGMAEGLQDTQGQQGVAVRPPTIRNALLNATATTAIQQSQELMSDLKNKQPIIEVPAGTEVCIIFGGGQG